MRNRDFWPPAILIATLIMVVAASGLVASIGSKTASHTKLIAAMDTLAQSETGLDQDVLSILAGVLPHYDPLVTHERDIKRQLATILDQPAIRDAPRIREMWQSFGRAMDGKLTTSDDIRRTASFVETQIRYLPLAIEGAESLGRGTGDRILAQSLVLVLSAKADEDVVARLADKLAPLEAEAKAAPDSPLANVMTHLKLLAQQRRELQAATRIYFATPTHTMLTAARDAYLADFNAHQEEILKLVWGGLGLATILFVTLAALLAALGRASREAAITHERMRKLTTAVEQSPIAIIITNREGEIEYVNPGFTRLTGYGPEDVIGSTPRILKSGRTPSAVFEEMWKSITAGLTWQGEIINRRKDGSLFTERSMVSPVVDEAGQITHFIGMKEDITALRANEEKLVDAYSDIERLLFAASHDLQEPVRQVLLYSKKFEREAGTALSAEARASLSFMHSATAQMRQMIAGLAAFARAGRNANPFVPVSCRALVAMVVKDLIEASEGLDAEIEVGNLPIVEGDSSLLAVLFQAVIGNALKFRAPGRNPHVRIDATRDGAMWRIDVADNGIGIDAEYLHGVVRPFSRLHGRETYPGAGLGLSTARRIARLHGGDLDLDSQSGQGTVVHVTLRAAD